MEDNRTLTAYLCAKDAAGAIDFYKRAFGAEERYRLTGDDGRIGHAEIAFGASVFYLSDEWPEMGVLSPQTLKGNSASFVLDVPDADAAFQRAVDAGAKVERPVTDQPYGRGGWLIDPFGHRWSIMTANKHFDPQAMNDATGGELTARRVRRVAKNAGFKRLRTICLAFPEAEEKVFGGHTTPTYRVRDKIFVMQSGDDARPAFWCKAPPGAQRVLVGSDPERFFAPPYVGPKGWIGVYVDAALDWDLAEELIADSYRMTAPKRLLKSMQ